MKAVFTAKVLGWICSPHIFSISQSLTMNRVKRIGITVDFGYKEHLGPGESVPYNRLFPISEVHANYIKTHNILNGYNCNYFLMRKEVIFGCLTCVLLKNHNLNGESLINQCIFPSIRQEKASSYGGTHCWNSLLCSL